MEIKKIKMLQITAVLLFLTFLVSCDNLDYKKIGETNYYLMTDWQGNGSYLYHNDGKDNLFIPIRHEGIVCDVYWNRRFVIIKCCKSKEGAIKYWYILKNIKEYNWEKFKVRQFVNRNDYELALDSMGICEKDMKHTNGTIPWRIHF